MKILSNSGYLADFSYADSNEILHNTRQVIFPISASEPISDLPLNTTRIITEKLSEKLSEKTKIFITTPILSGITTPFKPIADTGLHKNRFRAVISDCACSLNENGVKKIFFLVSSDNFSASINKGINDYKQKLSADFEYEIISWQTLDFAKKLVNDHFENLEQYWRNEALVYLLAAELFGADIPNSTQKLSFDNTKFSQWKKRGLDPDKLRNLSPNYRLSSWTDFTKPKFSVFDKLLNELSIKINKNKLKIIQS